MEDDGETITECGEDDKFWVPPTLLPRSTSSVIPAHEGSAALAIDPIASTNGALQGNFHTT
jgi:hypothetical protein